jgi:putative heme iron utilization protein
MKSFIKKEDFYWLKSEMARLREYGSYRPIRIAGKDYYVFETNSMELALNAKARLDPEERAILF